MTDWDEVAESEEAPTPVDRHLPAAVVELEAEPPPVPSDQAVTKRQCGACGAELGPCDCAREVRGVVGLLLERFIERMVAGGMSRVEAAHWANDLARDVGVTEL